MLFSKLVDFPERVYNIVMDRMRNNQFRENYYIKKLLPQIRKNTIKKLFIILPIQLLLSALLFSSYFWYVHNRELDIRRSTEMEKVKSAHLYFSNDMETIVRDFDIIHDESYLFENFNSLSFDNLSELSERLLFFSKAKRLYSQIRFLSLEGQEIIRIEERNGTYTLVEQEDLQNKSDRSYFREMKKLPQDQLYVSPIDLNIEQGTIDIPFKHMIRFGLSIFSSEGEKKGYLIFNYNLNPSLGKLEDEFKDMNHNVMLINEKGKYILSSALKRTLASEITFQDDYPQIGDMLKYGKTFQFREKGNLISIDTFNPFENLFNLNEENLININYDKALLESEVFDLTIISISKFNTPLEFFDHMNSLSILIFILSQVIIAVLLIRKIRSYNENDVFGKWMEAFFQGIEYNPASIVLTDKDGKILYTNKMFLKLSGYDQDGVYLENPRVLKSGFRSDEEYINLWKTISTGNTWSGEFHNKRKDGSFYWVYASISPIYRKNKISGYLGIQEDISEAKDLKNQMEELASTDSLTGLLNRRAFFKKVDEEIERCARSKSTFSILMIDIDHFKIFNDTYGHQTGDCVLVQTTKMISKSSRKMDIIGRYGGEEFILVLPETELIGAANFAERLRADIEKKKCSCVAHHCNVTVSIGVAQWDNQEDISLTIQKADKNLYIAKGAGRNQISY